jgi:NAD(P)-dependent dehydrogenase (short-subunit alcohol dehydrogenase family)
MTTNANGRFAGKVAFVTGAGNGIGRATAIAFAREGASVVAADRTEEHGRETVSSIEAEGGTALAVGCDVTSSDAIQAALQRVTDAFGRIDIAFNNAGVEQPSTPAADITEADWDRVLDTNLRGVFLCMKHEIPLMLDHGGGAIVNTSSGAGSRDSREEPPTGRPSSASSGSPSAPPSTTPRPASASTPSAPVSSTPP